MANNFKPEVIARRMLWLAFQAAKPLGMGALMMDAARNATEDDVFRLCANMPNNYGAFVLLADYVYGRCVKMVLNVNSRDVAWSTGCELSPQYQTWCVQYPTYRDLHQAAIASLEAEPQ